MYGWVANSYSFKLCHSMSLHQLVCVMVHSNTHMEVQNATGFVSQLQ